MLSHGAEREALRTQLVKAHEQVRSLEAKLVERDTHDPRTRLLVLDAFLEAAELALRACDRESAPFSAAFIPDVPHASSGRSGLFSQTSTPPVR